MTILDLSRIVKGWRPAPLKSEREYRDALFERLRKTLPEGTNVEKEYRHAGSTSDLYVHSKGGFLSDSTEVFLELKRNLTKKTEFDRLVGQIHGLGPKKHNIIILLIGEVDSALVTRLKGEFAEFLEERF